MAQHVDCERFERILARQQNELMSAKPKAFRARQEQNRLRDKISELQQEIDIARFEATASRAAPRVLGPGGVLVTGLSFLTTDIRIGRLEDEISNLRGRLRYAENTLRTFEDEITNLEGNIPRTERELSSRGCDE